MNIRLKELISVLLLLLFLPIVSYGQSGIVTKGLIGEQDIKHYDGVYSTFTRPSSTGPLVVVGGTGVGSGDVVGPSSSHDGYSLCFNGTTGKLIKECGTQLVIGSNVQAYTANLTTFAGIPPAANVISILSAPDYAAIKVFLSLGNVTNESKATMFTSPTFTGKTTTAASAAVAGAGFNLPHGVAPNTPANGDCWTTTSGLYCYINGATVGPYAIASTQAFLHIDDILTALGIASEATHFGTFTGVTIADSSSAKAALQALETSLELKATAADYVPKSFYDAYSILMATDDNTPVALTVGAQTLVGRKTGGAIAALSGADALLAMGITPLITELNYVDGVTSSIQTQLDAMIPKSTIVAAGDVVVGTGAATPGVITKGANNTIFSVSNAGVLGFFANSTPVLTSTPASDHLFSGTVSTFVAGEQLEFGEVVYCKPKASVHACYKYDRNGTDKAMPPRYMATAQILVNAAGVFLVSGIIRHDAWAMTTNQDEGKIVYASTTAGAIDLTLTTTSGDKIAHLGYVIEENVIYFNPSPILSQVP